MILIAYHFQVFCSMNNISKGLNKETMTRLLFDSVSFAPTFSGIVLLLTLFLAFLLQIALSCQRPFFPVSLIQPEKRGVFLWACGTSTSQNLSHYSKTLGKTAFLVLQKYLCCFFFFADRGHESEFKPFC